MDKDVTEHPDILPDDGPFEKPTIKMAIDVIKCVHESCNTSTSDNSNATSDNSNDEIYFSSFILWMVSLTIFVFFFCTNLLINVISCSLISGSFY